MSDAIDWVVDMEAPPEQAQGLADAVLAFLLHEGIILAPTRPSCWNRGPLHPPGPHAAEWSSWNNDVTQCGVEVVSRRTVFHAGDNGLDALTCPGCGSSFGAGEIDWSDAVGRWYESHPDDRLKCPACRQPSSIAQWAFGPMEWGFGNLAFGFNNWAVSDRLVAAIGEVLGHRCRLVHEHI